MHIKVRAYRSVTRSGTCVRNAGERERREPVREKNPGCFPGGFVSAVSSARRLVVRGDDGPSGGDANSTVIVARYGAKENRPS